jgi:branched-chain amino acid transport system substrate-binding protein
MPAHNRATTRTTSAILLVGAVAGVAALAGCQPAGKSSATAPDPIRLGTMASLTGDDAANGEMKMMIQAQQMAVREANEAGGVLGRKVELLVEDEGCDPGTGVLAANKLIAQHVVVSVGGACSSSTVPALKIFHDAGVPMIIPAANSTELLTPGYDSVFLVSGTVKAEAQFALESMQKLGSHRVAVVHDGTSFPETLAQATVDIAARSGSSIAVGAHLKLSQGAPSYSRIAQKVVETGADTVFYTGYATEAHQLILDLHAAGYTGKIIGSDGVGISEELLKDVNEGQAASIYRITLAVPQFMPALAPWSEHFTAATGSAPLAFTPEAYDAVKIALDAIRRAGSLDPAAVRQAVARTSDLKLLTGNPRFNPDGTRVDPTFLLLSTKSGILSLVASNRDVTASVG